MNDSYCTGFSSVQLEFPPQSGSRCHDVMLEDTFLNPEKHESAPEKAYLFVRDLEVRCNNEIHLPAMFWALDKEGTQVLSEQEVENILDGFGVRAEDVTLRVDYYHISWNWFIYGVLRDLQVACGFNPESHDLADYLGIPHAEIEPLEMRFQAQGKFF